MPDRKTIFDILIAVAAVGLFLWAVFGTPHAPGLGCCDIGLTR